MQPLLMLSQCIIIFHFLSVILCRQALQQIRARNLSFISRVRSKNHYELDSNEEKSRQKMTSSAREKGDDDPVSFALKLTSLSLSLFTHMQFAFDAVSVPRLPSLLLQNLDTKQIPRLHQSVSLFSFM